MSDTKDNVVNGSEGGIYEGGQGENFDLSLGLSYDGWEDSSDGGQLGLLYGEQSDLSVEGQLAFDDMEDLGTEYQAQAIERLKREMQEAIDSSEVSEELAEQPAPTGLVKRPNTVFILAVASLILAAVALVVSLAKTDLTITRGELFVDGGSVNKRLENLIRNDLSNRIPADIRVNDITVKVELNGDDLGGYERITDIGEGDRVTASVEFIPQSGVDDFIRDCRAVLDIMGEQGIIYDDVEFFAEGTFAKMRIEFNGRFRMDITAEELSKLIYYYGDLDVDEDIDDLEPQTEEEQTEQEQ